MPYYAQTDDSGLVHAVTETSGPITGANIVPISSLDNTLLGKRWDAPTGQFVDVPVAEVRHISVGAFFDRFGAHKWAILADQNAAVRAVVQDASVRRYIDLDNPQLPAGLGVIVQAGHAIDAEAIVSAPVQSEERA